MRWIVLLAILISQQVFSNDYGVIPQEIQTLRVIDEARTKVAVANKTRYQIQGRDVAGLKEDERVWQTQFESIMQDDSARDWLGLALAE